MKVFITRYALSGGIQLKEANLVNRDMVASSRGGFYHKPDWHTEAAGAIVRAEKMRDAKIASLTKSLERLKGLNFTVPE